jgi:phage terminase small subunit
MANELSIAQLKFCSAHIENGGNADRAFEYAYGYSQATKGYSSAAALMAKPHIQVAIINMRDQLAQKLALDRERVLSRLKDIAYPDDISAYESTLPLVRPERELSPASSSVQSKASPQGLKRVQYGSNSMIRSWP